MLQKMKGGYLNMSNRNIINYVPNIIHDFFSSKKMDMEVKKLWSVVASYLITSLEFKEDLNKFLEYRGIKLDFKEVLI